MKPGGGRPKGNAFERKVAGEIVKTFRTHGIKKDDCYRTPGSGGHRFASKTDPGDLVISKRLRRLFPFNVECKNQKTWSLEKFFKTKSAGRSSPVDKWVTQLLRSTKGCKYALAPLLVMQNRGPIYCAYRPTDYGTPALPWALTRFKFSSNGHWWQLVLFNEFLKACKKGIENGNQ